MKTGSLLKVSGVVTATLMLASAVSTTAYAGTTSNKTAVVQAVSMCRMLL